MNNIAVIDIYKAAVEFSKCMGLIGESEASFILYVSEVIIDVCDNLLEKYDTRDKYIVDGIITVGCDSILSIFNDIDYKVVYDPFVCFRSSTYIIKTNIGFEILIFRRVLVTLNIESIANCKNCNINAVANFFIEFYEDFFPGKHYNMHEEVFYSFKRNIKPFDKRYFASIYRNCSYAVKVVLEITEDIRLTYVADLADRIIKEYVNKRKVTRILIEYDNANIDYRKSFYSKRLKNSIVLLFVHIRIYVYGTTSDDNHRAEYICNDVNDVNIDAKRIIDSCFKTNRSDNNSQVVRSKHYNIHSNLTMFAPIELYNHSFKIDSKEKIIDFTKDVYKAYTRINDSFIKVIVVKHNESVPASVLASIIKLQYGMYEGAVIVFQLDYVKHIMSLYIYSKENKSSDSYTYLTYTNSYIIKSDKFYKIMNIIACKDTCRSKYEDVTIYKSNGTKPKYLECIFTNTFNFRYILYTLILMYDSKNEKHNIHGIYKYYGTSSVSKDINRLEHIIYNIDIDASMLHITSIKDELMKDKYKQGDIIAISTHYGATYNVIECDYDQSMINDIESLHEKYTYMRFDSEDEFRKYTENHAEHEYVFLA